MCREHFDAVAIETTAEGSVRLRLEDGSEEQLSVPAEMSGLLWPGRRVVIYRGPGGGLLGFFIPELRIGQDLRS